MLALYPRSTTDVALTFVSAALEATALFVWWRKRHERSARRL